MKDIFSEIVRKLLKNAYVQVGIEEVMDGVNLGNYNKFRITELVAEDKAKAYLWIRQNEVGFELNFEHCDL